MRAASDEYRGALRPSFGGMQDQWSHDDMACNILRTPPSHTRSTKPQKAQCRFTCPELRKYARSYPLGFLPTVTVQRSTVSSSRNCMCTYMHLYSCTSGVHSSAYYEHAAAVLFSAGGGATSASRSFREVCAVSGQNGYGEQQVSTPLLIMPLSLPR